MHKEEEDPQANKTIQKTLTVTDKSRAVDQTVSSTNLHDFLRKGEMHPETTIISLIILIQFREGFAWF